jgi:3-hydroxybutyryl-CoA dehydrogenase
MHGFHSIGVIGAGTMGHGIAQVCSAAGCSVLLFDVTRTSAEAGLAKIAHGLSRAVENQKVTALQREETLRRIALTTSFEDLRPCDLVIEAAPEQPSLKHDLFRKLAAVCRPQAVLASNTSSLSLTEIASVTENPERVIGMHFFNPVHAMRLLEVVAALQTSSDTIGRVKAFGQFIGKECIVVKDAPGFASSRLGVALGLEALRMLEEGVASAEDIDKAMKLGYGHPMGPLELGDLVGLDVRLAIAEHLFSETGSPTFRPPLLLKKLVRAGKLGKKTGEGVYRYSST